jgi:anti-sigma factor RsiW
VDCSRAKARIFAYVDSELDPEGRVEVEAHLADCRGCANLVELELRFREASVHHLWRAPVPERVRQRVKRRLAELGAGARPRAHRPWRRRVALAAAALCLVAIGAGGALLAQWTVGGRASLVDLAEAAVDQHQKLSRDVLPPDIQGVTPKGAEEWFRKRLAFNISLPELPANHLTFRGGRISHLHGVEAAALAYQVEGSDVSLFIVPGEAYRRLGITEPPRFKLITRRGYDVIVWQSHEKGIGYALVSEIGGRACLVCHSADEVGESAASLAVHH